MNNVKRQTPPDPLPRYRVPLPATIDLVGEKRAIQVYHCQMPTCSITVVLAFSDWTSRHQDAGKVAPRLVSAGLPAQ